MCGITGYIDLDPNVSPTDSGDIDMMINSLIHRGPDDKGVWMDPDLGIAMGHTRLSIQDLSDAGHQPMKSSSGQYIIVFNGEIYNYLEIKRELEKKGVSFRTKSDTEVLLNFLIENGTEKLNNLLGMFAFSFIRRQFKTDSSDILLYTYNVYNNTRKRILIDKQHRLNYPRLIKSAVKSMKHMDHPNPSKEKCKACLFKSTCIWSE